MLELGETFKGYRNNKKLEVKIERIAGISKMHEYSTGA